MQTRNEQTFEWMDNPHKNWIINKKGKVEIIHSLANYTNQFWNYSSIMYKIAFCAIWRHPQFPSGTTLS